MPRKPPAPPSYEADCAPEGDAHRDDIDPVTRALCDRVRALRRERGWSLAELSTACGVSRSMLSQIERAEVNPTLAVAHRIAQAFGTPLSRLIDAPAGPRIQTVRGNDRSCLFRSDRHCRIRTLSPLAMEKEVEFYELVLRSGAALRSEAHFRGARELLTVQAGKMRVTADNDSTELKPGDSAHYPADTPHVIENLGESEAKAYLVVLYT
ncbi:helix-turn-helix domain-containing protein [Phycisphaerales bacterium AB-hyl4]|uniref:Helix-turn-helix domain-containing protein n=1 Tax=Natronomicrosphaera hydrolytica TaxID=3242702 RepID=A0ABV4U6W3_9BACT